MKGIILTFGFLSIIFNTLSQEVDVETAKIVASSFLFNQKSHSSLTVSDIHTEIFNNKPVYYIVNFNDNGWVIVAANKSIRPILGYSENGEFSLNKQKPEPLNSLLNEYRSFIRNSFIYETRNLEANKEWEICIEKIKEDSLNKTNNTISASKRGAVMWGQSKNNDDGCSPSYNNNCPTGYGDNCNCDHKPAGCGAVAMGQIMWDWEWPKSYRWNLMPKALRNSTPTVDANEIARLLRDCGVESNMTYWCSGSWTTVNNIEDAFKSFNYKGVEKRVKSNWSNDIWKKILQNEIDCNRLVFYRGDKSDLSINKHHFIIDGYSSSDPNLFHVNWGWKGSYNGYYNLSDMTPGSHEYNKNQMAIIGISPSYEEIPMNIFDVNYTTISDYKTESARDIISIPATEKRIDILSSGEYYLVAGSEINLSSGFEVKSGAEFETIIDPTIKCEKCGLELLHIDNAIMIGQVEPYGCFDIRASNVNSYEFSVINDIGCIVYQSAGLLENNVTTSIWNGEGADYSAVYVGGLTLRNNCGERYFINQEITVIRGEDKNTTNTKTENDSIFIDLVKHKKNTTSMTSDAFTIFPNPSKGIFNIMTETNSLPYNVTIYNNLGIEIYRNDKVNSRLLQINIQNNVSGYYLLEIKMKGRKYYKKIVVY